MFPALAGWLGKVIAEADSKFVEASKATADSRETGKSQLGEADEAVPKSAPPTPHVLNPEARRESSSGEAAIE